MKALILTAAQAQDQEVVYPLYRLREEEWEVEVAVHGDAETKCILGVPIKPTIALGAVTPKAFDLLVIPGGVKAMEKLRLNERAVSLVKEFAHEGKMIASICSGAQMLISANLVRGRKIAAYDAMRIDVENAGGTWSGAPAVIDGKFVTSPHYKYAGEWMKAVFVALDWARESPTFV